MHLALAGTCCYNYYYYYYYYCYAIQAGEDVYTNFGSLTPAGGPAPSIGQHVDLPVSDGSFDNLTVAQPQPGVEVPGPAPAFPSIALANELNGTAVPPSAAAAPAGDTQTAG